MKSEQIENKPLPKNFLIFHPPSQIEIQVLQEHRRHENLVAYIYN